MNTNHACTFFWHPPHICTDAPCFAPKIIYLFKNHMCLFLKPELFRAENVSLYSCITEYLMYMFVVNKYLLVIDQIGSLIRSLVQSTVFKCLLFINCDFR